MTKALFFADYHFHDYKEFAKPVTTTLYGNEVQTTDRVVNQLHALDQVFDIAEKNNATFLLGGGDFFHRRVSIDPKIQNLAIDSIFYNMMKNSKFTLNLLVGNHDMVTNQMGCSNSVYPFRLIPGVTVTSEPSSIDYDGFHLFSLPYGEDIDSMKTTLNRFAEEASTHLHSVLMAHIGVDGANTGNYTHRLSGAFTLDDLHPDKYDFVLLGHYHKRQFLTDNVLYGGNLVPNDFSDEQEKGVHLLDFDKHTVEFIPIKSPKFLTFNESNVKDLSEDVLQNNYVRIQLPEKAMKKVTSRLSINQEEIAETVRLEKKKSFEIDSRINIDVTSSEADIVSKYADEFCPEAKQKALEILKKAEVV